jgi:acyl-CoA synthetase (NDP forming)
MTVVETLLAPCSIAVVGASAARPTAGTAVIANLRHLGYTGAVYPVNPKYEEVNGLRCYPSLASIPETPDVAFLGVPADGTVSLVDEAGRCGIRAVAITASGFADAGPEGAALQARLIETATAHGVAVCGPNNMGLVNWLDGVAIWTGTLTRPPRTGPIGVISQSGSVAMLSAADDRNIGLGIIVNSGNEALLTSAEYLQALVRDPRIGIVLHFAESVKRPRVYAAAAEEARRQGKPIIVLKVGRTELGRQATIAHTGSLAGADEEFTAFCDRYGLIRVFTLDEMLELAELFTKTTRRPRGPGACLIAMSGGEIALLSDLASDAGLPLAEFAPVTRAALRKVFPAYSTIANPLDAWGAGWNPAVHRAAIRALMADPSIGVIACAIDPDARNGRANTPVSRDMATIHTELLASAPADAPAIVFFNNVSAGLSPVIGAALDGRGIPYLQGTSEAVASLARWLRFHTTRRSSGSVSADARPSAAPPVLAALLGRASGATLHEGLTNELLAAYRVTTPRAAVVDTAAEAVRAAATIGYPVVLKALAGDLPHRSDIGGVVVNLRSAAAVRRAYAQITDRLRRARPDLRLEGMLVAEMVPEGIELLLGVTVGTYGPMVLVGRGGIETEVYRDVACALAPVSADEADALLGRLRLAPLLAGTRGRRPYDRAAVGDMLVRLSRLAVECAPWIAAVDLNPVIVHEAGQGAVAVDALVVVRRSIRNGGIERS